MQCTQVVEHLVIMPRQSRVVSPHVIRHFLENFVDETVLRRLAGRQADPSWNRKKLAFVVCDSFPSLRELLFSSKFPSRCLRNLCLKKGLRVSGVEKRVVLVNRYLGFLKRPHKFNSDSNRNRESRFRERLQRRNHGRAPARATVDRGLLPQTRSDSAAGRSNLQRSSTREETGIRREVPIPSREERSSSPVRYSRFVRERGAESSTAEHVDSS